MKQAWTMVRKSFLPDSLNGGALSGSRCMVICAAFGALFFVADLSQASDVRTQIVPLQAGWNAVFLEVGPEEKDPNVVFSNTPIDTVVAPLSTGQTAQFVSDPSVDRLRLEGWAAWYEKDNPQSFLTTLFAVLGHQAYLVHSREAFVLSVTGTVRHQRVKWQPDQFNLVGFSVMSPGAPTFAQFFDGSKAHQENRIYRMVSGRWRQVQDASAETMRSGEAFWIFCNGSSTHQGPLRAKPNGPDGMLLASESGTLALFNDAEYPVGVTIDHLAGGDHPAPLSILVQTVHAQEPQLRVQAVDQPAADWTMALPPIEVGRSQGVPLQARLVDMVLPEQRSLLRITTDIGTVVWIPVECVRKDLIEE
jgi:hypothetical protein